MLIHLDWFRQARFWRVFDEHGSLLILFVADHRIMQDWIATIWLSCSSFEGNEKRFCKKTVCFGGGTMVLIFLTSCFVYSSLTNPRVSHVVARTGGCWGLPRSLFGRLARHFQRRCGAFPTGDDGHPGLAFPPFLNEMSRLNQAQPASNLAAALC